MTSLAPEPIERDRPCMAGLIRLGLPANLAPAGGAALCKAGGVD